MIKFREIKLIDAKKLLDWRTKDRITKFMDSDIEYNIHANKNWIRMSYNRADYYHWIIQYRSQDIGLISINDLNFKKKSTNWGFYIGEDSSLGIGGFVPPYFYNFAFNSLGINIIKAEVFFDNIKTINLHLAQGYRFEPSNDHVIVKKTKKYLRFAWFLKKKNLICQN